MSKPRNFIGVVLLFLLLFSCGEEAQVTEDNSRPRDPWVFRSVLDLQPRMITLALHEDLWVAYSTERASLYQVWKGDVQFEGAVYDAQHGPQPTTRGRIYTKNKYDNPWSIRRGNQEIQLAVNYLGHKIVDDKAVIMYQLQGEGTPVITMEETVDVTLIGKRPQLNRSFSASGVSDSDKLLLDFNASSILIKKDIASNGSITYTEEQDEIYDGKSMLSLAGKMELLSEEVTQLDVTFMTSAAISNPNDPIITEDFSSPEGMQLIIKSGCKTCHNKNLKTIGPAYVSVANKYTATEDNISMLVGKIKNGGSGVWGEQVMNPHPQLSNASIRVMVDYILSLRTEDAEKEETSSIIGQGAASYMPSDVDEESLLPGLITFLYKNEPKISKIADLNFSKKPIQAGVMNGFDKMGGASFGEIKDHFSIKAMGWLKIDEDGTYEFRLGSDDGSQLFLGSTMIIDNDGNHGATFKNASLDLKQGYYPISMKFFEDGGGEYLSLEWKPEGKSEFSVLDGTHLMHNVSDRSKLSGYSLAMSSNVRIPGHKSSLTEVHPSFDLHQARPIDFTPKVGGMDFFSDGRLAVSTWDAKGSVYVLSNLNTGNEDDIVYKKIADGLAEPLGLKIVDDEIYVVQKQELTKLIDNDNDGIIDEYRTLCDDWEVSANFHEFTFGLAYKDGYFYGTLATAIEPGGASTNPQLKDRGKVFKVSKDGSDISFIAHGLRTPNGIDFGYNDELYVADNQGDWLPSCKILHIEEGDWLGSRSVDLEGTAKLKEKLPVVWLPQDEIGNSPSTPMPIEVGPYAGQMIHGEVTHGGIKRVYVEEVEGGLQGAVFRFSQGLEAGVNRMSWQDDNNLFIGGVGSTGNWQQTDKLWYGLQRLTYNEKSTFEMLSVSARSNGIEIEFTEPLNISSGNDPSDYDISQWYYKPTPQYGGPKLGKQKLSVSQVNISEDRKKVFLKIAGIKSNHVVYVNLSNPFISDENKMIWTSEAWYTMNKIPRSKPGFNNPAPQMKMNSLTSQEINDGWKLLFDGKTTSGWRGYKKETLGSSWKVRNGELYLDAERKPDGRWAVADGGDIITDITYDNYELNLEWKIGACGNSGIIFHVQEEGGYKNTYETGPEMQILDNSCHPDTKYPTHRAGDLYDMIETKWKTVKPAGSWNKIRLISDSGKMQHWLNGYLVVEYDMKSDAWKEMVSKSKFSDWKGFGKNISGHIALQDHSDPVFFRNIKIKSL